MEFVLYKWDNPYRQESMYFVVRAEQWAHHLENYADDGNERVELARGAEEEMMRLKQLTED